MITPIPSRAPPEMTALAEFVAAAKAVSQICGLLSQKIARRKWTRVRRVLYGLKPAEVITSRGLFLFFWDEALGHIPLPPAQVTLRHRLLYRLKKTLMPFNSEQEVENFMLDQRDRGLVEMDPLTKGWRLPTRASGR